MLLWPLRLFTTTATYALYNQRHLLYNYKYQILNYTRMSYWLRYIWIIWTIKSENVKQDIWSEKRKSWQTLLKFYINNSTHLNIRRSSNHKISMSQYDNIEKGGSRTCYVRMSSEEPWRHLKCYTGALGRQRMRDPWVHTLLPTRHKMQID